MADIKKKIIERDGKYYQEITEITETEIPSPTARLKELINQKNDYEDKVKDAEKLIKVLEKAISE